MNLSGFLSKPRWLSKDAETRRDAVAHDQDSELVANLGRLAREDTDAGVRAAAMKRLADPGIVQGLAHDDVDATVRRQARALWFDLLTGTHANAPSLVERVRLLKAQDDNELVEHIARQAREPELRQAALQRVTRTVILVERALADADPAIRANLVERIDDEAQLARLADRARKSDKQVSRRARERIEALRIVRGDSATLEQRARQLCERLEQCVREPQHADAEAGIEARWAEIEAAAPDALRRRYQAARNLLVASRNPLPSKPAPIIAPPPDAAEAADDIAASSANAEIGGNENPAPSAAAETVVAPLLAQARFAASLDNAKVERQQKAERQRALLGELEVALGACDAALDSGASAQAHVAKSRLDELRRSIDAALPHALARHVSATEARYVQLSQWQQWADNQRRRQLCEEIEALAESGVHPDAVASRVREAQVEWSRLEAVEPREKGHSGSLGRRFHAACRAAFAPTQAYFKKRQELRQSHAQQVTGVLERVATLNDDSSDWDAISTLRRETVEALRGLDRVEPRERKQLAQRLKNNLSALDTRIKRRDDDAERAKAALIAEAQALSQGTPQRGAAIAARELQQRWQRIGNGRRSRDQAQWKTFRAALDGVFGALDAERAERTARDTQSRADAEALCLEMEALAASTAPERAAAARLKSAWDNLRVRDEHLARRFEEAESNARETALHRERASKNARFSAWLARYRLCRAAERKPAATDDLRERWTSAPTSDIATDALEQRFAAAIAHPSAGSPVAEDDLGTFRDVLIELEFLAGVEVPEQDREARRALQVARLARRMRGDSMATPAEELDTLLTRWSALGPAPGAEWDRRLEDGVTAAIETLP
jgi:exonuclease SbcC